MKWANGTVENLGEIPGDSEYVSTMLEILRSSRVQNLEVTLQSKELMVQESMSQGKDRLGKGFGGDAQQSLNQAQPSISSSSPFEVFKRMGQQLREKVELSLPHPIIMLGVTHPAFFSTKVQETLRNAIREAGLNPLRSYEQTSGQFATAAGYRVRLCRCPMLTQACSEFSPRGKEMVLYVDYNEFAITIVLYEVTNPEEWNDGGISYIQRTPKDSATGDHDADSDHDMEEKAVATSAAQTEFWNDTIEILRDMASKALRNRVDYLLLSGTRAADHKLHEALKLGLGARFQPSALTTNRPSKRNWLFTPQRANPLLAAAQGAADLSWRIEMRRYCLDPCSTWRYHVPQCLPMASDFGTVAGSSDLCVDYDTATVPDLDVDVDDECSVLDAQGYLTNSLWQFFMGHE